MAQKKLSALTRGYVQATLDVFYRERVCFNVHRPYEQPARGARYVAVPINLDRAKTGALAMKKAVGDGTLRAIMAAANIGNILAWQEGSQIMFQYQLPENYWRHYTRADLQQTSAIGLATGGKQIDFSLNVQTHTLCGQRQL